MRFDLEQIDEKQLTKFIIIAVATMAAVMLTVFARQYENRTQNLDRVNQAIQSLYLDEDQTYLKPGISREEITDVQSMVGGISGIQGKQLNNLMAVTEEKYDAIENLSELYQNEEPVIVGEEVRNGSPLKEIVTPQLVNELKEALPSDESDELLNKIDEQYDDVLTTLEEIDSAEKSVQQLADTVNAEALDQQVEAYTEVEDALLENQVHPQAKPVIEKYRQKCAHYGEGLKEHADMLEPDSALVHDIFSTRGLSRPLTGSKIDPRPLVALTFDDGPTENTLEILKILDEHQVTATFFLLGKSVENKPDIARAVVEAGHLIGNHSYSHPNFDLLELKDIAYETDVTQELIQAATGVIPTMYRSPYGNGRKQMMKLYPEMDPVYWNVDSEDWLSKDEVVTVEHILAHLQHRSIILMHDTQSTTTEAIKELIPRLKEEGYIFVSPTQIPEADSYRL